MFTASSLIMKNQSVFANSILLNYTNRTAFESTALIQLHYNGFAREMYESGKSEVMMSARCIWGRNLKTTEIAYRTTIDI
jgi:hypothetical protein